MRMARGDTRAAISAFEQASEILDRRFRLNLELGVLYLADRQYSKAAMSLDKVSRSHPAYPMALFKRAQVSVLLREADSEARVRQAWQHADNTTRQLIVAELALFGFVQYSLLPSRWFPRAVLRKMTVLNQWVYPMANAPRFS